jgi:hypothetical protein
MLAISEDIQNRYACRMSQDFEYLRLCIEGIPIRFSFIDHIQSHECDYIPLCNLVKGKKYINPRQIDNKADYLLPPSINLQDESCPEY